MSIQLSVAYMTYHLELIQDRYEKRNETQEEMQERGINIAQVVYAAKSQTVPGECEEQA